MFKLTPYTTTMVMGGIITEPAFTSVFPSMNSATIQGVVIASFELGALVGALSCLDIGDRLGRRATVATIPSWQSECAKPHSRGRWGGLQTFGVACGQLVGYAFYFVNGQAQWRVPVAIQLAPALIVFLCINFLPESPRWLIKHGLITEATHNLSKLRGFELDDPILLEERDSIVASFEAQAEMEPFSYRELFQNGKTKTFYRVAIGLFIQSAQQLSGINMVSTYANKILQESFDLSPSLSHFVAAMGGLEYTLCSLVSVFLIEGLGRRKSFLWTAFGMGACFCIIGGLTSTTDRTNQLVGAGFLFLFNTLFGLAWVGGPFLYSAEIAPLRCRSQANAIASAGNWLFCFVVVMIIPPAFASIGWKTYIIFAIFNFCFCPIIYFFLVETKKRSLEELDVIFAAGGNPVKQEQRMGHNISVGEARQVLGLDVGPSHYSEKIENFEASDLKQAIISQLLIQTAKIPRPDHWAVLICTHFTLDGALWIVAFDFRPVPQSIGAAPHLVVCLVLKPVDKTIFFHVTFAVFTKFRIPTKDSSNLTDVIWYSLDMFYPLFLHKLHRSSLHGGKIKLRKGASHVFCPLLIALGGNGDEGDVESRKSDKIEVLGL
ncbi:general substrate transporter [Aureobasidium subglaciale]|nr:general substrate transporter [Aureobasidium subglaciale]